MRNFECDASGLLVNQTIGCEDDRAAKSVRIPNKIADSAAGFFHEKNTSGGVPAIQAKFPEGLKAASGDAGKIERGGSIPANAVRAEREIPVVVDVGARLALVRRKTGAAPSPRAAVNNSL
jgi:hypothetical protein